MTDEDQRHFEGLVLKHVPRSWRTDIKVEGAGRLAETQERSKGTVYVKISTRSKLGRAQAMMSIGPYVANDPDEWSSGWSREDGKFTFCVYEPSAQPTQMTIVEAAEISA